VREWVSFVVKAQCATYDTIVYNSILIFTFAEVMVAFSGFYVAARPATVMEFNSVLNRVFQELERAASKSGKKKSQKAIAAFLDCSQS
jgi:hypothetical protein